MEILELTKKENLSELIKFIEEGNIIEKKYDFGRTILILSTINGNIEAVKILIRIGANINARDYINQTALFYACEKNYLDIVKILISFSPKSINLKNKLGKTPILKAASEYNWDIVKYLIENKAKYNNDLYFSAFYSKNSDMLFFLFDKLDLKEDETRIIYITRRNGGKIKRSKIKKGERFIPHDFKIRRKINHILKYFDIDYLEDIDNEEYVKYIDLCALIINKYNMQDKIRERLFFLIYKKRTEYVMFYLSVIQKLKNFDIDEEVRWQEGKGFYCGNLLLAAYRSDFQICKILINLGADYKRDYSDDVYGSILSLAKRNDDEIYYYILEKEKEKYQSIEKNNQ